MRATRIEGADPEPLGAPRDWDPEIHGHCGGLFIRREVIAGAVYMRSAWETEQVEAQMLTAGGHLILSVRGSGHPVVLLQAVPPPPDAEPAYTVRRTVRADGARSVRVDAFYPCDGGRRCYCEVDLDEATFGPSVAVAIDHCDALARGQGWIVDTLKGNPHA